MDRPMGRTEWSLMFTLAMISIAILIILETVLFIVKLAVRLFRRSNIVRTRPFEAR